MQTAHVVSTTRKDGKVPDIAQSLLTTVNSYEPVLAEYALAVILSAIVIEGSEIPVPGQSLLIAGALSEHAWRV